MLTKSDVEMIPGWQETEEEKPAGIHRHFSDEMQEESISYQFEDRFGCVSTRQTPLHERYEVEMINSGKKGNTKTN